MINHALCDLDLFSGGVNSYIQTAPTTERPYIIDYVQEVMREVRKFIENEVKNDIATHHGLFMNCPEQILFTIKTNGSRFCHGTLCKLHRLIAIEIRRRTGLGTRCHGQNEIWISYAETMKHY